MKDHTHHRPENYWSDTAVHRPIAAQHYHYLKRPKWSHGAQEGKFTNGHGARKYSWPFCGHEQPPLPSVPTECRPLMGSDTDDTPTRVPESTSPVKGFTEKYGRCLEILHYGSNSTTRLHQSTSSTSSPKSSQLLAIKVYRYNILDLSNSRSHNVSNVVAGTSCSPCSISNHHPDHPNILQIMDLLYNERSELCLVMPFCEGGDLHELLSCHGPLPSNEADCIIAQILRALSYLHEHDTAHRDIRLETVLLTAHGAVKLAGFGNGHIRRLWNECAIPIQESESSQHSPPSNRQHSSWSFSLPWLFAPFKSHDGEPLHSSVGFMNSTASFPGISQPYIPPEGLKYRLRGSDKSDEEYENDPRPADIWSTAIVYLALIYGRLPWRSTRPRREDTRYLEYLRARLEEDGYPPIEALGKVFSKNAMMQD
ncbi:uncharacterized protein N7469_000886 [Penicillium citrinum]|uniref:non-specific serine/threonine protein kinase n=1 Tax=Penicillium citrinum TaxID=5077 RepID=A0A9W9TVT9_PENCI|nr:uncharacterized protein N7469_000886 [Penicillium citrinum]KAJ5242559.1 hypothetical protein N7469_000886 [Penicillium citrinum]